MLEGAAWGRSVYKSHTNWMDVLQLLCFMVCERIKGALSLCLAWRTILYCWSCTTEWCGWISWWKDLGFHAIKLEWIYHSNSHNSPCVRTLYKRTFDATNQLATCIQYMHKARSESWLIARVWLWNNRVLGQGRA